MSHTPGPWRVKAKGSYRVLAGDPSEASMVANCWSGPTAPGREIAAENALLISAAPDLLAACQSALEDFEIAGNEICRYLDHDPSVMACVTLAQHHLRAAIAKAKGGVA